MHEMQFANLVRDLDIDDTVFRRDMDVLVPAERTYVIVFTPRSGSTWLTSVLSATNKMGHPEEYINPDFVRAVAKAQNSRDPDGVLQMLKRRRKTSNGIFGIEVRAIDVKLFDEDTFFRVFNVETTLYNLWRDNIVAQGISLFRAVTTQHYHSTDGGARPEPPPYDADGIQRWLRHVAISENDNLLMLQRRNRSAQCLRYEDIVRDRAGTIEAFARSLGVPYLPGEFSRPGDSEMRKVGDYWNEDAEQRFRSERADYVSEIEGARLIKKNPAIVHKSVADGQGQAYTNKRGPGANGEPSAGNLPLRSRAMNLEQIFKCKLVDLGGINGNFRGILTPESEVGSVPKGVTAQFKENAQVYHQKYFSTDQTDWLFRNTFARIEALGAQPLILDIGSGSGSTVISLLKMFKDSRIVASDVSAELLSLLRAALERSGTEHNVTTVCLDLNKHWFSGELFDFGVGKAILHHLFDPALLVEQVFKAIKPGGSLAFYEPFEPGNAMLALVLRQILDEAKAGQGLDDHVATYLQRRIDAVRIMRCEEKPVERYAGIDDKWMFTRSYFERVAKRIGAERLVIYPTSKPDAPFREAITTWLRIGLGRDSDAVPQWAWNLVGEAEKALSADCREDILMTGCVVFTKAANGTDGLLVTEGARGTDSANAGGELAADVRQLTEQVSELERLLGRKTLEIEVLKRAAKRAPESRT